MALKSLILAVFIGLVIYASMNLNGFCWPQKKWLSDDEIIRGAISYRMRGPDSAYAPHRVSHKDYVPYKNEEEFLKTNPNCCEVRHTSDLPSRVSLLNRMLGHAAGYVLIEYKANYHVANGSNHAFTVKEDPIFSNCGDKWYFFLD